eukprot:423803-Prymnesium_polylepis.2
MRGNGGELARPLLAACRSSQSLAAAEPLVFAPSPPAPDGGSATTCCSCSSPGASSRSDAGDRAAPHSAPTARWPAAFACRLSWAPSAAKVLRIETACTGAAPIAMRAILQDTSRCCPGCQATASGP